MVPSRLKWTALTGSEWAGRVLIDLPNDQLDGELRLRRHCKSRRRLNTFPDIPDPDCLVKRPRHDEIWLRVIVDAKYIIGVSAQDLRRLALRTDSGYSKRSCIRKLSRMGRCRNASISKVVLLFPSSKYGQSCHQRRSTTRASQMPMQHPRFLGSVPPWCSRACRQGRSKSWQSCLKLIPFTVSRHCTVREGILKSRGRVYKESFAFQWCWRQTNACLDAQFSFSFFFLARRHADLQELASHFPSGENFTLETALRWPTSEYFNW